MIAAPRPQAIAETRLRFFIIGGSAITRPCERRSQCDASYERRPTRSSTKLRRFEALRLCDQFVTSATDEAAYGMGLAFFGRMRAAADAIPADFEALDKRPAVKGQDKRLQPYLRSQLFIALISELEDFLFSLLRLIIVQYPKKLGSKTVSVERLVELGSDGVIRESIDKTLNELAYASPAE